MTALEKIIKVLLVLFGFQMHHKVSFLASHFTCFILPSTGCNVLGIIEGVGGVLAAGGHALMLWDICPKLII